MGRESWRVPPEADGLRADAFLRLTLPELPESVLRRIFAARDARLDGRRVGRRPWWPRARNFPFICQRLRGRNP